MEDVAAGATHSLLVAGGAVFGAGDGGHGQLGLGDKERRAMGGWGGLIKKAGDAWDNYWGEATKCGVGTP